MKNFQPLENRKPVNSKINWSTHFLKKRTYLIVLLASLVVIFFVQQFLGFKPEDEQLQRRSAQNNPAVRITLEDIDVMSPDWESVAGLLQTCAEMGYYDIELNGAKISLPTRPIKGGDQHDQLIIHRKDVPRPKLVLDGPSSPALSPEEQYDFDAIHQWCSRYKDGLSYVIFGNGVRADVLVRVIQVFNQHNIKYYLKNVGTPFGSENPMSIKFEL